MTFGKLYGQGNGFSIGIIKNEISQEKMRSIVAYQQDKSYKGTKRPWRQGYICYTKAFLLIDNHDNPNLKGWMCDPNTLTQIRPKILPPKYC